MARQPEVEAKARKGNVRGFRIFVIAGAVLAIGLLLVVFSDGSPGAGVTVAFSGYSTNASGARVAIFNVVSSHQQALLYRAMSDPPWTRLLGVGSMPPTSIRGMTVLAPERFVRYGRLSPSSRMQLEVPEPSGLPADRRYRLTVAYCGDHGRFVQQVHRFWRNWVWRWVPHKPEPFAPPGFGSVAVRSQEVAP